jgi:hypothetical protein
VRSGNLFRKHVPPELADIQSAEVNLLCIRDLRSLDYDWVAMNSEILRSPSCHGLHTGVYRNTVSNSIRFSIASACLVCPRCRYESGRRTAPPSREFPRILWYVTVASRLTAARSRPEAVRVRTHKARDNRRSVPMLKMARNRVLKSSIRPAMPLRGTTGEPNEATEIDVTIGESRERSRR